MIETADVTAVETSGPTITKSFAAVLRDRLPGWSILPVLEWLASEGQRIDEPNDFTLALALRMHRAKAPIVRLRLSSKTLDPDRPGWSAVWHLGQPSDRNRVARFGFEKRASYIDSPISIVDRTKKPYHVALDSAHMTGAHPILKELAAQGVTDYLILPVRSKIGSASMALATDRMNGFSEFDLHKFCLLTDVIAPMLELAIKTDRADDFTHSNLSN